MARKQVYGIGLLPDRRVVRVAKVTSPIMREIIRRVGRRFPDQKNDPPTRSDIETAMEEVMIAMTVRGIVKQPVPVLKKKRPPTAAEAEKFKAAKAEVPTEVEDIDLDAMLKPYADKDSQEFQRWIPLGEQQLENAHDDNEFHMDVLFEEPAAWKAVIGLINANSGGTTDNPFEGKLLKTSSG
jgi:hypothetical protein